MTSLGYLFVGLVGIHRLQYANKCYCSRFAGLSECSVQKLNPYGGRIFLLFHCSGFQCTARGKYKIVVRRFECILSEHLINQAPRKSLSFIFPKQPIVNIVIFMCDIHVKKSRNPICQSQTFVYLFPFVGLLFVFVQHNVR